MKKDDAPGKPKAKAKPKPDAPSCKNCFRLAVESMGIGILRIVYRFRYEKVSMERAASCHFVVGPACCTLRLTCGLLFLGTWHMAPRPMFKRFACLARAGCELGKGCRCSPGRQELEGPEAVLRDGAGHQVASGEAYPGVSVLRHSGASP